MVTLKASPTAPRFSHLTGCLDNPASPPLATLTEAGRVIMTQLSALKGAFLFVKILRRVIMPEHIHFVIFIEQAGIHLGDIMLHFKHSCTRMWGSPLFEAGYHDRILLKDGQLQKMLDYVSDNPRRRLIRMQSPGFYSRRIVHHDDGRVFESYGNVELLVDPDIEPVKISSCFTADELRKLKIKWLLTVENGGVLASPFISEAEKRVMTWCAENGGRIILIQGSPLGCRYTPKGLHHHLCSEGRLLIIAPYEPTPQTLARQSLTRSMCSAMNELAVDIAEHKLRF